MRNPVPYPLTWPKDKPRTKSRKPGTFRRTESQAIKEIHHQIQAINGAGVTISSNLTRHNSRVDDPGVAVYFTYKGQERVIAIDRYYDPVHNICAIANSLDALRSLERHGGLDIFEQALKGFDIPALDMPRKPRRPWHEILMVFPTSPISVIEAAYRAKAAELHPDSPRGSKEAFQELQDAIAEAREAQGVRA